MISICPVLMADLGIPSYFAVDGSWDIVRPPSAFIALTPLEPSLPVPDSITPIANSFFLSAKDSKNKSTDGFGVEPA